MGHFGRASRQCTGAQSRVGCGAERRIIGCQAPHDLASVRFHGGVYMTPPTVTSLTLRVVAVLTYTALQYGRAYTAYYLSRSGFFA
jgi:hypothetical protein